MIFLDMIELLEMSIIFSAAGGMTMSFSFYGYFSHFDIALLIIAIIYSVLPMEKLNDYIFPIKHTLEVKNIPYYS
jgi:hypothetical protein